MFFCCSATIHALSIAFSRSVPMERSFTFIVFSTRKTFLWNEKKKTAIVEDINCRSVLPSSAKLERGRSEV